MEAAAILKKIQPLLDQPPLLCLSTASKTGEPESAVVYYAVDAYLNVYFMTKEITRKETNMKENPHVSLLLFDQQSSQTLQMQGRAKELNKENEKMAAFDLLIRAMSQRHIDWPPPIGKVDLGNLSIFKITLTWIRLGDFHCTGENAFEQLLG